MLTFIHHGRNCPRLLSRSSNFNNRYFRVKKTFSSLILQHETLHSAMKNTDDRNIVILHGLFGSSQNWRTVGRRLGSCMDGNVYGLDLRNHGHSFHDSEMDYSLMAMDVKKWIEYMRFKSVSLIGHSMVRHIS
jgi:pimeloyl-ACP methyl ester carboxylesterase